MSDAVDYVDGYHGGHLYGVPVGSWRNLVGAIKDDPDWALVFDLEPDSWKFGLDEDPEAVRALLDLIVDKPEQYEFVNHAYGHPYHWVCDGEWNFRHFLQGEKLLHAIEPRLVFRIWGPQEPMWTSGMPAILTAMGYEGAVLKDPGTAFAGLTRGLDAAFIDWVGPDGSRLPTVPRYACEQQRRTWETDARYMDRAFIDRCRQRGIESPVGTGLQDIGWRARRAFPYVKGHTPDDSIHYLTWGEYFSKVPQELPAHRLQMDDFLVGLPWGDAVLDRVAQAARQGEWSLRLSETADALFPSLGEKRQTDDLERTVLRAQHHDNWICARWRDGDENFCVKTEREIWQVRTTCREFVERALRFGMGEKGGARSVALLNPLGQVHSRLLRIEVPVDTPDDSVHLIDGEGRSLACQIRRLRTDDDFSHESNNWHVEVIAAVDLPPLGAASWELRDGDSWAVAPGALTVTENGRAVTVSGPRLGTVELSAEHGGGISSWIPAGETVDRLPRDEAWGTLRGLIDGEEVNTTNMRAELVVRERGPLSVRVSAYVEFADFDVETTWLFSSQNARADVDVCVTPRVYTGNLRQSKMELKKNTSPGLNIGRTDGETDVRRLIADNARKFDNTAKLRMAFPMGGHAERAFREGPGDVGEARLLKQGVDNWHELAPETCIRWVDFMSNANDAVAVFTDRPTAFVHTEGHEPAIVIAYAGAPFLLTEPVSRRFALYPHQGNWQTAGLWNAARQWEATLHSKPVLLTGVSCEQSLLSLDQPAWELTCCRPCGDQIELRIYNSAGIETEGSVDFVSCPPNLFETSPRGVVLRDLSVDVRRDNRIQLSIPGHGWKTLRMGKCTDQESDATKPVVL